MPMPSAPASHDFPCVAPFAAEIYYFRCFQAALDRLAASNSRAADAINADINDRLMEYKYSSKYRPLQVRFIDLC